MRPSSRSEHRAGPSNIVTIEIREKRAREIDVHPAIVDPERFLSCKPRSCIDEFVLALLSYYVAPSSDLQRLIHSYLATPRLLPGDKIAYFDMDLVKDIPARVISADGLYVNIETTEGIFDIYLSDVTYHWGQWVHDDYWKCPFRTDREFIGDSVRIWSYLPLLDRYLSSSSEDVSGHIADVNVSVRGVIQHIADDKTLLVEVDWQKEHERFKTPLAILRQFELDQITPAERSWRFFKKEPVFINKRYKMLNLQQKQKLQAECARAAPMTYCCRRRVWPVAVNIMGVLLLCQILLNMAYSSYVFNGYAPLQDHCFDRSSDTCVSEGGTDFYGSVCYYSNPTACFPASAPLIISLGFGMCMTVIWACWAPFIIFCEMAYETMTGRDFEMLWLCFPSFLFMACTCGAALSNTIGAKQMSTYVPLAFSLAMCVTNLAWLGITGVFMWLGFGAQNCRESCS